MTTSGAEDIYFAPIYPQVSAAASNLALLETSSSLFLGLFDEGDMNQDGTIDSQDASSFALALTDPDTYFDTFFIDGPESGDIDDDGDIDFDDIDDFAGLIPGMSVARLLTLMQTPVPEPSSTLLMCLGAVLIGAMRYRPQCWRCSPL